MKFVFLGIIADVPILGFSSLMLAPELIRIQEKPAANWVPTAKTAAIRQEFVVIGMHTLDAMPLSDFFSASS